MKTLSGLASLAVVLLGFMGCGKLGGGPEVKNTANTANAANAEPAKAQKAVDVPSVVGKTIEEMKTILGPPTRELAGRYTWEFPQGDLAAETDYKDKKRNKVDYLDFTAKMVSVGNQTAQGYPDYQRLGDLIGVDTRGKSPTSSESGDTGTTRFEKFDLGGKTVDEISFQKVSGSFRSVTVRPVRGY